MVEIVSGKLEQVRQLEDELRDYRDITSLAVKLSAGGLFASGVGQMVEDLSGDKKSLTANITRGVGRFLNYGGLAFTGVMSVLGGVSYYGELTVQKDIKTLKGKYY